MSKAGFVEKSAGSICCTFRYGSPNSPFLFHLPSLSGSCIKEKKPLISSVIDTRIDREENEEMESAAAKLARGLFLLLLAGFPAVASPKSAYSSPWGAFLNITGCHVGEHVAGVGDLKRYLERFGYMSPENATDDFDDSLESALKTYQKNFNLNATGALDFPTASQMVRPRCGVPDIVNGTTSMNSSGSESAGGRRHLYEFFAGAPRWPVNRRNLTYAISERNRISVGDATLREIFGRAFQRWAAVTQLAFSEAAEYEAADIKIGFYSGAHGDDEPFDGRLGTLAHAFSPPNGHFHLDLAENWATASSSGDLSSSEIDLESVAVHEIGHLLGLGHSSVESAIMYPTIPVGVRRVELASDDVEGVQALYGTNPGYNGTTTSNSAQEQEREEAASGGGGGGASAALALVGLSISFLVDLILF